MPKSIRKEKCFSSRAQVLFFAQAGLGTAFTYLTSGVFLSGLAMLMGAGDVLASYLSVLTNICGMLILAFAGLMERFRSRKRLTIGLTVLSKAATLLIVIVPAVVPFNARLWVMVPVVIAAFTLQAQTTVVLNQWMQCFVNEKKSGQYISLRQTLSLAVTVALSIAGGYWMDYTQGQYWGLCLLFAFAGVMGGIEILFLIRTPDSPASPTFTQRYKLRELARLPLQNRRFRGFAVYVATFYLLLTISDSFTTVYLLKYLGLSYQTVTGLFMLISLPQIVLLSVWGKISDQRGHDFALKASIWLFAGETLFMSLVNQDSWRLFVPAAFLMAACANAGFSVAVFNRRYELMPKENRIIYDHFYAAAVGLGSILGPMAGGMLKGLFPFGGELGDGFAFASVRMLYLLSTAGILILQIIALRRKRDATQSACS